MICTQPDVRQWDNCVGSFTYGNGNFYRGEYHHGLRAGFGVIYIHAKGVSDQFNILSNEPSMYIGEFRDSRLNGHGVWITASGTAYAGTFINNIPQSDVTRKNCSGPPSAEWTNCVATMTYPNGNVYHGEFVQGQRQGVGLLEINTTGVADAHTISAPMPGIYVGQFSGDRLNGRGMILMPAAGLFGTFADNVLMPFGPSSSQ